jgi:hypothetical protein
MRFPDLIGQTVLALIPILDQTEIQEITIHGVEVGGIWIESQRYSELFLAKLDLHAIRTPIFFVPYHEIRFVMHRLDKLELSEKKFGV